MTPSLRRGILIGSILWTAGMVVLVSAAVSVLFEYDPSLRLRVAMHLHGVLQAPVILLASVACMVAGLWSVRRGLARLDAVGTGLTALRDGHGRRLDGRYPSEVQPLVDDLNTLLDRRDAAVARAIAKAGDLAHGLKTPLAILMQEAETAERAGRAELAEAMRTQIGRMRRSVDYHLVHARAAASGTAPGTVASIKASADGLARAMLRLHASRGIALQVDVPAAHAVAVQPEDLDEMLGNLMDNACKWARSAVRVGSTHDRTQAIITIDDDGPGLPEHLRVAVLARGVRADEATPGSGLGLAIVRDLTDIYGGSIALDRSRAGGCRAVLTLPGATP